MTRIPTPPHTSERAHEVAADDGALLVQSLLKPAAFDVVFERHHARVFGYLVRRVGISAAEDVLAETALAAFASRGRFDGARAGSALPWLLGIATKLISRHRAAQGAWMAQCVAVAGSAVAESDASDAAVERIDAERAAQDLAAALGSVPPRSREPLLLHVLSGLTYEEVAAALDLPIGTVRSRINRARTRLAGLMDGVAR